MHLYINNTPFVTAVGKYTRTSEDTSYTGGKSADRCMFLQTLYKLLLLIINSTQNCCIFLWTTADSTVNSIARSSRTIRFRTYFGHTRNWSKFRIHTNRIGRMPRQFISHSNYLSVIFVYHCNLACLRESFVLLARLKTDRLRIKRCTRGGTGRDEATDNYIPSPQNVYSIYISYLVENLEKLAGKFLTPPVQPPSTRSPHCLLAKIII